MKINLLLICLMCLLAKASFSQCSFTAGISVSNTGPCGSPILTINNSNADGVWSQMASFTGGRWQAAGFSIGSKGYIGTGTVTGSSSTLLNDFWEYDPANDTWTQKANFGGAPRMAAIGFSIGNKGYIGAGFINISLYANDFWEYDPTTNIWTQKANIGPTERSHAFGFVANNKGYVGTGRTSSGSSLNDIWEYDPALDTWSQKNNFGGIPRSNGTAFAINGKGYAGTGLGGNGLSLNDFWEYDPATDSWVQKANFAGGLIRGSVGLAINDRGFLCTGYKNNNYSNVFWEYNVIADNWIQKPNFAGIIREGATGFVIGSKAYIGAGYSYTSGFVNFDDLWQYDPTVNISWSNGITQQSFVAPASGTYTATVTDQLGCSVVASQAVTAPAAPALSITGPSTVCAGSPLSLTANGASTFTWSSNAGSVTSSTVQVSPLTSTAYTVSGTTGLGCITTPAVIAVSVVPALPVSIAGATLTCEGRPLVLTASGATSYSWSNGATTSSISVTPTAGIVYSVNGAGNTACGGSASTTVTVNALALTTASSGSLLCPGESVTLTAGGANLYIWSTGIVAAATVVHPMTTTVYTVTGMSGGCSKTATVTQEVAACTGIATRTENDYAVHVYPNPNNGLLNIDTSSLPGNTTIEIYNYTGQLIASQKPDGSTQLNFENAAAGIYILRITSGNKQLYTSKVVKQ